MLDDDLLDALGGVAHGSFLGCSGQARSGFVMRPPAADDAARRRFHYHSLVKVD
jgi:hypothetical protein